MGWLHHVPLASPEPPSCSSPTEASCDLVVMKNRPARKLAMHQRNRTACLTVGYLQSKAACSQRCLAWGCCRRGLPQLSCCVALFGWFELQGKRGGMFKAYEGRLEQILGGGFSLAFSHRGRGSSLGGLCLLIRESVQSTAQSPHVAVVLLTVQRQPAYGQGLTRKRNE